MDRIVAAVVAALVVLVTVLLTDREVRIVVQQPAVGPPAPTQDQLGGQAKRVLQQSQEALESDLRKPLGALRAPNVRVSIPPSVTLAAPEQRGCSTRLVRNFSSRNGRAPLLWVLHYTVSPNRPGLSDMDAVAAWFNNPQSQASSHYLVDNEGHCYLLVPESQKAWTQATFNPVSISAEVVNTGREPSYAGSAGLQKLARVIADSAARWRIPLRRAVVRGCTVVRSGIIDHAALGECGGGHHDIKPYSVDEVIAAARAARAASGPVRLTRAERRDARLRCYHRARHLRLRRGSAAWAREIRYARYRIRRLKQYRAAIEAAAKRTGWDVRDRRRRYRLLGRYITGRACR